MHAATVPLPSDGEEDDDGDANESQNLISFSSVYETFGPSARSGLSERMPRGALESVEQDLMLAETKQAENTAKLLLEETHNENEQLMRPILRNTSGLLESHRAPLPQPPSLTNSAFSLVESSHGSDMGVRSVASLDEESGSEALRKSGPHITSHHILPPPATPQTGRKRLIKEVNSFQNSPSITTPLSLADVLFERNDKTGSWWRSRNKGA